MLNTHIGKVVLPESHDEIAKLYDETLTEGAENQIPTRLDNPTT
jgi:hypothetical protein